MSRGLAWSLCVGLMVRSLPVGALDLPCEPDVALAGAAAELLLANQPPSALQLLAAVRAAGSDAVGVRALFLPRDDAPRAFAWLSELTRKSDAPLVCGDARAESARLIVASARGGTLLLDERDAGRVRGSLAPGFARAELVVLGSDGKLSRFAAPAAALASGIPLDPELHATKVQLVASGSAGPRPVAERSLPGAPAPDDASARVEVHSEGPLDARGVLQVVAQLREARGRPTLREHRMAGALALAHARGVCAQGRVAHTLEPGVDPQVRVARAGLSARLVGETVARAENASAAVQALWDSPSHRLTLLEPRFTHIGVGEALDHEGRTCLVVLLLAWPRYQGR